MVRRDVPGSDGTSEIRLSVIPYPSGPETTIATSGQVLRTVRWFDSTSLVVASRVKGGLHLSLVDVRTNSVIRALDTGDSATASAIALPNGWAWLDARRREVLVAEGSDRRVLVKPSALTGLGSLAVSHDGTRLLYTRFQSARDSASVEVVPLGGGPAVRWATFQSRGASAQWLSDGSIAFVVFSGPETASIYRLTEPGKSTLVGNVPHVASALTLSDDMQRATIGWSEDHGDAWLYRVVKP